VEFAFVEDGIAYISDPAEVPQNITAQSRLLSDGGCLTETVAVTDVIATVDVDLDALFDPPYTLGF
jgi:hypothetical protein